MRKNNGTNIRGKLWTGEEVEFVNTDSLSLTGFRQAVQSELNTDFSVNPESGRHYVSREEIDPDSLYRPDDSNSR